MLATDASQQQQQPCTGVDEDDEPVNQRPVDTYKASYEFQIYERLCRGEQTHVRVRLHRPRSSVILQSCVEVGLVRPSAGFFKRIRLAEPYFRLISGLAELRNSA